MINIIAIGTCTILDILRTDPNFHSKFKILFKYHGAVSRLYYQPGQIANRLYDDKQLMRNTNSFVQGQIQVIVKKDNILDLIRSAPKNTVVLLDYAYEFNRYFFNNKEMFDICSFYPQIKNQMPEWFNKEVDLYLKRFDEGDIKTARLQYENLIDFATQSSNHLPTILFSNTLTSKVYFKDTNSVGKILPLFNKEIPLGRNIKFDSQMMAYQYNLKIINNFYQNVDRNVPKKCYRFNIDTDGVYADLEHPWGYHPCHYHYTCRSMLVQNLNETIQKSLSDYSLVGKEGFEPTQPKATDLQSVVTLQLHRLPIE